MSKNILSTNGIVVLIRLNLHQICSITIMLHVLVTNFLIRLSYTPFTEQKIISSDKLVNNRIVYSLVRYVNNQKPILFIGVYIFTEDMRITGGVNDIS